MGNTKLLLRFINGIYLKIITGIVIVSLSGLYANAQTDTNTKTQLKGAEVENTKSQNAVIGNTYAIIFGVSNYPGLTPLKYADKDAELFRDFLETPAGGNTKAENIFYRTNENAKAAAFNFEAYTWLKRKALKEGDRLYIYFSGHGDAMNEDNYFLLPYDCTPNNDVNNYLATGVIEMYHIKTLFIKPLVAKKVEVLLVVDACRTNDLPGGQQGQQNFVNYVQSIAEQKEGEIIMLSTGAGQSAIESAKIGNGHGLFTWYLIAGLSGDADKEGDAADHDGKVSLAEITSYVKNRVRKDAKNLFNADQVPVFLPPDKDLETIAMVDSVTYSNWKIAQNMLQQTNGNGNMMAVASKKPGKKAITEGSIADTALIALDNKFIAAIKTGKLTGTGSAEEFYNKMAEKWPGEPITEDAKYSLATEFINFGQEKINLFLSGKGLVNIQRMENEFKIPRKDSSNKNKDSVKILPPGVAEQIGRMKTLATTGFDKAADMMRKAINLLKDDPELLEPIYPKFYFLKAASYNYLDNNTKKKQGIELLKRAVRKDSTAAYNYLVIAHFLYDLNNDSCEIFYKKAVELAPKWANPENGLGNFYSDKHNYKLAILHYNKAIRLDSLDDIVYQNIGTIYQNSSRPDSAKKWYFKALSINPCETYANGNLGSLYKDSLTYDEDEKSTHFQLSEKYLKKAITCDSTYTFAYTKLAEIFDHVNKRDSSIFLLRKGIRKNPYDASLMRNLADEYFYKYDTARAENLFKTAYLTDSLDVYNALSLAEFYGRMEKPGKAFSFYSKAIAFQPTNPAVYNSIGNDYINIYHKPDSAVIFYRKGLKLDSNAAYINYNLGRIYGLNLNLQTFNIDSNIYYYEKAVRLDSVRYPELNSKLADLYYRVGNNKMSIYYYRKCLDNHYYDSYGNYVKYLEAIIYQLVRLSQFDEAENIVLKYLPLLKDVERNKLLGLVDLASSKYKDAEFHFIKSFGLDSAEAERYQADKFYPCALQSRFPDREGLLTNLYNDQFSFLNDSLLQNIINEKVIVNNNYFFPFSRAISLSDIDAQYEKYIALTHNTININGQFSLSQAYFSEPALFQDSIILNRVIKTNSGHYKADLWIMFSVVDSYCSYKAEYKNNVVKFRYKDILPVNYKNRISSYGASEIMDPRKDRELQIKNLMEVLKTDSLNPRLYVELGDSYLQLLHDHIISYNYQISKKSANKRLIELLDSTITDNYQKAIYNYKKAIKTDKSFDVVAFCRMGDFYMQTSQIDEAKKCYYHSITSDSSFIYPYAKLANHYYTYSNLDSALYFYKKLAKKDSIFQPFYDACLNSTYEKNNVKKALELNLAGLEKYYHRYNQYLPEFCINLNHIYADILNYPTGCDTYFLKLAQSDLNNHLDYYTFLTKYACKCKDTRSALLYFKAWVEGKSQYTPGYYTDDIVNNSYYKYLMKDPYFVAVTKSSPQYKQIMNDYYHKRSNHYR